jgi:hypothetical protein
MPVVSRRFWGRFSLAAATLPLLFSAVSAEAANPEIVHLDDDNHCSIVAVYKKERIGLPEVNAHRGVIIRDNIRFSSEGGSPCLTIRALVEPVRFDSDGLGGFTGDLPGSNQVSCCFCNGRGILDLATPAKNAASLILRFSGGVTASLSAGSTARLDFLKDAAFTFSGGGRVEVVNADGRHLAVGSDAPFITGGPLREVAEARGGKRQERLSPVIPFRIGGLLQGGLSLRIGESEVLLPASVERDFTLPNGASVRYSHDPLTGVFSWRVVKGHFVFSVDDIPGWSATGLSDSAGALRWNAFNKMVDFRNSAAESASIGLPLGLFGFVDARESFHFEAAGEEATNRPAGGSGLGFSATAATGGARVRDPRRHKTFELSPQSLLFAGGDGRGEAGLLLASSQDGFISGENAFIVPRGDRQALVLKAGSGPLKFDTESVGGASGELPGTNQVVCCFLKSGGVLELSTPTNNAGDLALKLPDGGSALVFPGSSVRVDTFQDDSYSLSARGRVEAANGDGQILILAAHSLPLTGGPLRSTTDSLGVKRNVRASPATLVRVGTWNKETLSLRIGETDFQLPPAVEKEFTLPNGSAMRCSQNPITGLLSWRVTKGDFMISVVGVPGWKACGLSGQSAEMHWDVKAKLADLQNTSPESLVISLPSHTAAVVDPKSVFQYEANDDVSVPGGAAAPSFATAATGSAHVDNLVAHKSYDVVPQSLLFMAGFPGKRDVSNGRIQVLSSWDNGIPLRFSLGGTNRSTMQPGSKKTVTYDKDHRIEFIYSDGGCLVVTAIEGNYRLILQKANGLVVDVDEGDRVTLTLDYKKGTFVMMTSSENSSIIALQTDSGAQKAVPPDHSVNFRIAVDGTITASEGASGGGVYLLDAPGVTLSSSAGASAGSGGLSPSLSGSSTPGASGGIFSSPNGGTAGALTGQFDPSRLAEPPASSSSP